MKNDPSSMQHWDSNPRPSEHESPPLTTRPGLPDSLANELSTSTSDTISMESFSARTDIFLCQ